MIHPQSLSALFLGHANPGSSHMSLVALPLPGPILPFLGRRYSTTTFTKMFLMEFPSSCLEMALLNMVWGMLRRTCCSPPINWQTDLSTVGPQPLLWDLNTACTWKNQDKILSWIFVLLHRSVECERGNGKLKVLGKVVETRGFWTFYTLIWKISYNVRLLHILHKIEL